MPQRIQKLRETVRELETELQSVEEVDEETRRVLEDAIRDLQVALAKQPGEPIDSTSESIANRLTAVEGRFQATHPTLSGVVVRLIDALGQWGI